jgi:hypothetical protein
VQLCAIFFATLDNFLCNFAHRSKKKLHFPTQKNPFFTLNPSFFHLRTSFFNMRTPIKSANPVIIDYFIYFDRSGTFISASCGTLRSFCRRARRTGTRSSRRCLRSCAWGGEYCDSAVHMWIFGISGENWYSWSDSGGLIGCSKGVLGKFCVFFFFFFFWHAAFEKCLKKKHCRVFEILCVQFFILGGWYADFWNQRTILV